MWHEDDSMSGPAWVASKEPEVWFHPWLSHRMRVPSWDILQVARICAPGVTFLSFSFHPFSASSQRHPEYPLFSSRHNVPGLRIAVSRDERHGAPGSACWQVRVCSDTTLRARHCQEADPNPAPASTQGTVICSASPQRGVRHKGWEHGAVLLQRQQGQAAAGNASPEPGKS